MAELGSVFQHTTGSCGKDNENLLETVIDLL